MDAPGPRPGAFAVCVFIGSWALPIHEGVTHRPARETKARAKQAGFGVREPTQSHMAQAGAESIIRAGQL